MIERQRLDKWIWFARFVKSRTLSQKLILSGAVRINGQRMMDVDAKVSVGDGITFTAHNKLRVVKVLALGDRRGPAQEAQALYEEIIQAVDI